MLFILSHVLAHMYMKRLEGLFIAAEREQNHVMVLMFKGLGRSGGKSHCARSTDTFVNVQNHIAFPCKMTSSGCCVYLPGVGASSGCD